MLTSTALRSLAEKRLRESLALLKAGHWDGAYYIAGYSAECALKAIVARQFTADAIPDKRRVEATYTHSIPRLIELAGLRAALDSRLHDIHFVEHWETLKNWSESARYREWSEEDATAMVTAVAHPESGILQWIRAHW